MARIILGTYAFRYPLGGNLSWTLQWAVGFRRLGHEVLLAEKSLYPDSCFDPVRSVVSDDCSHGLDVVGRLLNRYGLADCWCHVDRSGTYFGLTHEAVQAYFRSADVFIDLGTHGAWLEEANVGSCLTVVVDGEPGNTQMRRELTRKPQSVVTGYDHYYSNGAGLNTAAYTGPTAGQHWRAVYNPVVVDLFPVGPPPKDAPFTTVMTWQAHAVLEHRGVLWGQKDVEFGKFINLPHLTDARFDLAIAGGGVPREVLHAAGWSTRSARETTLTYEAYVDYIARSAGEFSVCKQAYVALRTGWFSDRSAAYLAAGRPVVMQDTGFSAHLPCGEGLFAVNTIDEAAAAIAEVRANYARHSAAATALARAHLDAA